MKKILICLLIVLLLVLGYYCLVDGVELMGIRILGVQAVIDESDEVDLALQEATQLAIQTYPEKISSLKSSARTLVKEKENYTELANLSTDTEIERANQRENYEIEFLWAKIGNHAKSQGVKLEMNVTASSAGTPNSYDLNFIIGGQYIPIMNFVEALENDSLLGFRIYNFKLIPDASNGLKGTFAVKDIGINLQGLNSTGTTNKVENNTNPENLSGNS